MQILVESIESDNGYTIEHNIVTGTFWIYMPGEEEDALAFDDIDSARKHIANIEDFDDFPYEYHN